MRYAVTLAAALAALWAGAALACAEHEGAQHAQHAPGLVVALTPDAPLENGKTSHITLKLTQNGTPVTMAMLKRVHTQKLHLLVVDPDLSDYHHLHPKPGKKPGEYGFDFTPRTSHGYRVWADVTLAKTGKQAYVMADLGTPESGAADTAESHAAEVAGYHFELTFDTPPKAGEMAMASLTVSKDGKPFAKLEPVMGAFAHMVGFNEDYQTILHIHPTGEEPKHTGDRGGPELAFHLEPEKAGFIKLFAQVRIGGKDVFVPFGVRVE